MTPESNQDRPELERPAQPLGGIYLTFVFRKEPLGDAVQHYGVAVRKIREIIHILEVTPVPHMPDYVQGIMNIRGKVIPVIDLRLRLELGRAEKGEEACIVVVEIESLESDRDRLGIMVDSVEEVINIAASEIEPRLEFGARQHPHYLLGIAKVKAKVVTLLDIERLLSTEEISPNVRASGTKYLGS